ncbi:hypothetical protein B0H19DRAFT_1083138 [Mycena capillaripes]|nr:hypothetical protein B0H19DRAFT_1083138 [Mycena capillaripes]
MHAAGLGPSQHDPAATNLGILCCCVGVSVEQPGGGCTFIKIVASSKSTAYTVRLRSKRQPAAAVGSVQAALRRVLGGRACIVGRVRGWILWMMMVGSRLDCHSDGLTAQWDETSSRHVSDLLIFDRCEKVTVAAGTPGCSNCCVEAYGSLVDESRSWLLSSQWWIDLTLGDCLQLVMDSPG